VPFGAFISIHRSLECSTPCFLSRFMAQISGTPRILPYPCERCMPRAVSKIAPLLMRKANHLLARKYSMILRCISPSGVLISSSYAHLLLGGNHDERHTSSCVLLASETYHYNPSRSNLQNTPCTADILPTSA
jgi:hypothetical protein